MVGKTQSWMAFLNQQFEQGLAQRGDKTMEDVFYEMADKIEREHGLDIGIPGYDAFRSRRRRYLKRFEQNDHKATNK